MRSLWAILLLLTAACQPEARRMLVVDYALADPLTLDATAAPWHDAGYSVEYRRFYPHLTRADLGRYRTVLVLGGREPQAATAALTIGDVAILNEWIRRDGVVVLAYADGGNDRWVMNQWLAAQGAGITIGGEPGAGGPGEAQLIDATPLPHSALDNAGVTPFPAGHNRPFLVRADGTYELLDDAGLVLGVRPSIQYGEHRCRLNRGDMLMIYSDGVTEAANAVEEEFGMSRLAEVLCAHRDETPNKVVAEVSRGYKYPLLCLVRFNSSSRQTDRGPAVH